MLSIFGKKSLDGIVVVVHCLANGIQNSIHGRDATLHIPTILHIPVQLNATKMIKLIFSIVNSTILICISLILKVAYI